MHTSSVFKASLVTITDLKVEDISTDHPSTIRQSLYAHREMGPKAFIPASQPSSHSS